MRGMIGAGKLFLYLALTAALIPLQWLIGLFTKGPALYAIPLFYHRLCCRLFGIRLIVEGDIARSDDGRRIVFAGNHISYLDITALGSLIPASFVAKKDVARWPLFGTLAKLQNTYFISRARADAVQEREAFARRLRDNPAPLIIFPEGTSSNGSGVLPFKSMMFDIFLNKDIMIQPFTISLIAADERNVTGGAESAFLRDYYAYHGDISLPPHLWGFAKGKGCVLKIVFDKPYATDRFDDRKALCAYTYERVTQGLDLSSSPA